MYIDQIDHKWCIVFFRLYFAPNHLEPYPHMCDIRCINGNNNKQHVSFHRSHVQNIKMFSKQWFGVTTPKTKLNCRICDWLVFVPFKLLFFSSNPSSDFCAESNEIRRRNLHLNHYLLHLIPNVRDILGLISLNFIEWHIRKFYDKKAIA